MERKTQRKSKTEKGKKKEADSPSEGYFAAFFSERNIVMWSVFERKLCCTQLSSHICCNKKGKISKCAKGKKVTLSWKLALVLRQKCTYLNTHIHVCVCVLSLSLSHTHTLTQSMIGSPVSFLLKNSMIWCAPGTHGQRSLAGYSPWAWEELDMTEQLSTEHRPNTHTHTLQTQWHRTKAHTPCWAQATAPMHSRSMAKIS